MTWVKVPETCPLINMVIEICKERYASDSVLDKWEMREIEGALEDIRQHNSELRQIAEEALKDLDAKESECNNLELEINQLKEQILNLEASHDQD